MDLVRFILGGVLPYVAVAVFVVAMAHRIYTWKRLAAPSMTLFPAPADDKANKRNVLKEALLFRSLFGGDRVLWAFAWIFHAVLLLIFIGHLRVFTDVDSMMMTMGMSAEAIQAMSGGVGGAAGVVILVATVLLLARRLALPRVREISGAADYLALLLIGAIIVTGNIMRFGAEHFDLGLTREYFAGLATFGGVAGQAALQNDVFMVHMVLAFMLVMVIPFSKILHFGGIFFTHELVRKH
ncbi:MAG: respiratory nitrate reductase subunit gamma [Gemmatimonadales bacterium]|jgi:nitrate reductase gamma subunit